MAALAVAACLLPARQFSTTVPGNLASDELPVTLEDRTGLVQALGPAQPGQFNLVNGVAGGSDPSVIVVTWLGGACDRRTHLVFAGRDGGYTIEESTERADAFCTQQGIIRTVSIGLSAPIDPALVTFRDDDAGAS